MAPLHAGSQAAHAGDGGAGQQDGGIVWALAAHGGSYRAPPRRPSRRSKASGWREGTKEVLRIVREGAGIASSCSMTSTLAGFNSYDLIVMSGENHVVFEDRYSQDDGDRIYVGAQELGYAAIAEIKVGLTSALRFSYREEPQAARLLGRRASSCSGAAQPGHGTSFDKGIRMCVALAIAVAAAIAAAPGHAKTPLRNDYVIQPQWVQRPSLQDYNRLFPRGSRTRTALVRLDCRVLSSGAVGDCRVINETPVGQGFGPGALELSRQFKMKPLDRNGRPVAGRPIRLPIRWDGPLTR